MEWPPLCEIRHSFGDDGMCRRCGIFRTYRDVYRAEKKRKGVPPWPHPKRWDRVQKITQCKGDGLYNQNTKTDLGPEPYGVQIHKTPARHLWLGVECENLYGMQTLGRKRKQPSQRSTE